MSVKDRETASPTKGDELEQSSQESTTAATDITESTKSAAVTNETANRPDSAVLENDDFGLPFRPRPVRQDTEASFVSAETEIGERSAHAQNVDEEKDVQQHVSEPEAKQEREDEDADITAQGRIEDPSMEKQKIQSSAEPTSQAEVPASSNSNLEGLAIDTTSPNLPEQKVDESHQTSNTGHIHPQPSVKRSNSNDDPHRRKSSVTSPKAPSDAEFEPSHARQASRSSVPKSPELNRVSEWSHQALAQPAPAPVEEDSDDEWQPMPAIDEHDVYSDGGKLVARGYRFTVDEDPYAGTGGAAKGYTRVGIDEDAQSTTSMDENTSYLFKERKADQEVEDVDDDQEEQERDPLAQMQATKDMLTEGQRIAYVGLVRLSMEHMMRRLEIIESTKQIKSHLALALGSHRMWGQKMMVRLYAHMDISSSEQVMIEQLAEHGVEPHDLTPALIANARVANPMADAPPSARSASVAAPTANPITPGNEVPPPYESTQDHVPEVMEAEDLSRKKTIDIDLRWTVLCDLFLVLISDSMYDSRSRRLLERVGDALNVGWLDICRFEKRVTEALEMREEATRETWTEATNMENRRKMALKRKYLMMGLATVGGGLVIGLSAGLLAPVIGAGLAAGFTTIGVAGTSSFLAGTAGTAIITTGAALSGGGIAIKAANRRTGAVRTFEYRPLHNNKRVNLIVSVAGWMNGKVDDVRLPFSTVDPIMGDLYSVFWEPEMLQSMGDTIRILATEALTQGLQQVLASTILTALMASLTLPVWLTKLSYFIDNPWSVSLARADAAGLILADSLMDQNLGSRPITLVGFSLGSRVIFSCLKELANKGCFGLIQNVFMFGAPVVLNRNEYLKTRTIVSGRYVNGYASNDWILGYLFRATSGGLSTVSGLAPVKDIPGVENFDCSSMVNGHMSYRLAIPRLLREVGWTVTSDDFAEIEDPDPENHEARHRELIQEIEAARAEAKAGPAKKRNFSIFGRNKLDKKGWETYDERNKVDSSKLKSPGSANSEDGYNPVLFDVDAIRRELESEQVEVKEISSTLPMLKVEMDKPRPSFQRSDNGKQSGEPSPALQPLPSPLRTKSDYTGKSSLPALRATRSHGSSLSSPPNSASPRRAVFDPNVQSLRGSDISRPGSSHKDTSTSSSPAFRPTSLSYERSPSYTSRSARKEPDYELDHDEVSLGEGGISLSFGPIDVSSPKNEIETRQKSPFNGFGHGHAREDSADISSYTHGADIGDSGTSKTASKPWSRTGFQSSRHGYNFDDGDLGSTMNASRDERADNTPSVPAVKPSSYANGSSATSRHEDVMRNAWADPADDEDEYGWGTGTGKSGNGDGVMMSFE